MTPFFTIKIPCFFIRQMWTDSWIGRKNHSTAPSGIKPRSLDCRSDALTSELWRHDGNCVLILVFTKLSVLFHYEVTRMFERTNRKHSFLSGQFHLIKFLYFFYPTNVNWQLNWSAEKNTAQPRRGARNFRFERLYLNPASIRWSLRVCRLEHAGHLFQVVKKNWQLGERQ